DTEPPDRARLEPADAAIAEPDVARVRRELAVDHVEAGRFAGAVRPDQRQELALGDVEADVVDGAQAAERLCQVAHREHAHGRVEGRALRDSKLVSPPTTPPGKASTRSRITPPSSARQYSVCRMIISCSIAKAVAPTTGPVSVWMPPSRTITMASTERPTEIVSGEIEPLANANSAPASPHTGPPMAKPIQCTRLTSMPIASARSGESRPARMA